MRPKGKLFALVVMFAAVGLITATGAFTTVEAERTATVETAGDADALLGIDVEEGSAYTDQSTGDTIELGFDSENTSASGVNLDAITNEEQVLTITNNGQDQISVSVTLSTTNGDAALYVPSSEASSTTGNTIADSGLTDLSSGATSDYYIVGTTDDTSTTEVTIGQGDSVTLGLYIDAVGVTSGNIFDSETITIIAEENSGGTGLVANS